MGNQALLDRIADLRGARSERRLCLDAGVSVDALRLLRRGHRPRADVLVRLAATLGVEAGELLGLATPEGVPPRANQFDREVLRRVMQVALEEALTSSGRLDPATFPDIVLFLYDKVIAAGNKQLQLQEVAGAIIEYESRRPSTPDRDPESHS